MPELLQHQLTSITAESMELAVAIADMPQPTQLSRLELLSAEIFNKILGYLLDADRSNELSILRDDPNRTVRVSNRPEMSLEILRVNKNVHAIAKSYLDCGNSWVVFDIDYVQLLLPHAALTTPMIVIDPHNESQYKLPTGIAQVRVKLHIAVTANKLKAKFPFNVDHLRPDGKRVLVHWTFLPQFLRELQQWEMSCGAIVMTGEYIQNDRTRDLRLSGRLITAKRGTHGLCLCLNIDPSFPSSYTRSLLENLMLMQAPSNELSINGLPDSTAARSAEVKFVVSLERYLEDIQTTISVMCCESIQRSAGAARMHNWLEAYSHTEHAIYVWYGAKQCISPWPSNHHQQESAFDGLLLASLWVHERLTQIATSLVTLDGGRVFRRDTSNLVPFVVQSVEWGLKYDLCLIDGLFKMLCRRRVEQPGRADTWDLVPSIVREGFSMLDTVSEYYAGTHMPKSKLLVAAEALRGMMSKGAWTDQALMEEIELGEISVREALRPWKWRVHESYIPPRLIEKGILKHLTKMSTMTEQEKEQFLIHDALGTTGREGGEYYCI